MRFTFFLFFFFFFTSKNSEAIQFESLETKNGIQFWLIEDKTLPLVSLSFSFKGGSILDPVNQDGVTNLMTSLLTRVQKILLHQSIDFSKEKTG